MERCVLCVPTLGKSPKQINSESESKWLIPKEHKQPEQELQSKVWSMQATDYDSDTETSDVQ